MALSSDARGGGAHELLQLCGRSGLVKLAQQVDLQDLVVLSSELRVESRDVAGEEAVAPPATRQEHLEPRGHGNILDDGDQVAQLSNHAASGTRLGEILQEVDGQGKIVILVNRRDGHVVVRKSADDADLARDRPGGKPT